MRILKNRMQQNANAKYDWTVPVTNCSLVHSVKQCEVSHRIPVRHIQRSSIRVNCAFDWKEKGHNPKDMTDNTSRKIESMEQSRFFLNIEGRWIGISRMLVLYWIWVRDWFERWIQRFKLPREMWQLSEYIASNWTNERYRFWWSATDSVSATQRFQRSVFVSVNRVNSRWWVGEIRFIEVLCVVYVLPVIVTSVWRAMARQPLIIT
jgi:hypothetical protein